MAIKTIIPAVAIITATAGCSTLKPNAIVPSSTEGTAVGWNHTHEIAKTDSTTTLLLPSQHRTGIRGGKPSAEIPKVRIYKTNGDYYDKVPVTLNASRTALLSFPAPTDLSGSEPVKLDDGFLLDRRGITPSTAFTRWTYAEYSALPSAPSPKEIMENLIPDARVTSLYEMPFTVGTSDVVKRCNALIADSLPDCRQLIMTFSIK